MNRGMRFAPYVAFFLSGASSLIFQTIWTRMLHHVFGATSVAVSTVLTVFMAGLGLGTWISGRYAHRIKHPIFAYAIAELGVAVWGLLIPFMVQSDGWLADVNSWARNSLGAESGTFMLVRFVCMVPILLVPTTLMGSTFPLLTRHFISTGETAERASAKVGILYSLNTFGAATGPLLSAFILMPNAGLMVTNVVACSMNLTLALMIFALREQLIGSKWGSGVKLEVLPGKEEAASPAGDGTVAKPAPVEAASDPEAEGEHAKGTKKAKRKQPYREAAEKPPSDDAPEASPAEEPEWVPPIARTMGFIAFACSGGVALCYEVVWTRALAMTIGSSIYSFSLILETFLIGIAAGSAAMSSFFTRDHRPLIGIGVVSAALVALAAVPIAVDIRIGDEQHYADGLGYAAGVTLGVLLLGAIFAYAMGRIRSTQTLGGSGADEIVLPGLVMILVPATAAVLSVSWFYSGYLPKIVASVVGLICIYLASMLVLRRKPVLLLAVIQLFIALATTVSYIWQDEIPYAFAQLVVGIEDLPDHVQLVQFFMFVTATLCTLPATLGMGAMFPLTIRVWTSGGRSIAKDVSIVYTGNTLGSIVGAWLPGFVLLPLLGMERTLHLGIVLSLLLALAMLIAGAAEPEEKTDSTKPSERARTVRLVVVGIAVAAALGVLVWASVSEMDSTVRSAIYAGVAAISAFSVGLVLLLRSGRDPDAVAEPAPAKRELPTWHAVTVYILAPLIPALIAFGYVGTQRSDSMLRWNLTQMTLGVFRVSLAEGMLDPESWGQPDLVYYHDGLSTTVSVERWGRHYALKNNGKVDASNGDDMPTQVTVAAYPLLMHPQGPTDLDVAVIGFGSGVTVGTAMSFPVRRVDVIELERAIPEAARFFQDVNHLEYTMDHWPYIEMDRLSIINDDGRNYLASTDQQYDVIISEPSNPWITGVSDLFTVDHFEITKRRLRPGGVYCQWVQLYELSPENIKTIFRTFAQVYRYVIVLAADDRSSDTVVLGSDAPLVMDLERFQGVWDLPAIEGRMSVDDQLERAYLHAPYDVYARVLLATREEVLAYTQIEERLVAGEWQPDYGSTNGGTCEAPRCRRVPVTLNTDDNARIEFAAPRDLIGFERYEGYLGTIYSHEWPYGRIEPIMDGFGEGDARARHLAELSMSLISHGRYEQAAELIEQSQRAGRARETAIALEVLTHLLSTEHEPQIRIEAPIPGPELDRASAEQLTRGYDQVRAAVDRGAFGAALAAMEEIPQPLRLHSGPALRFLYGYLLFKAADGSFSQYRASAENLEELVRSEEAYVAAHPEVYYYLARAYDAEGEYGEALQQMRRYVEARLSDSHADLVDVPEPPDGEAPTTDAPGEADKTQHEGPRT